MDAGEDCGETRTLLHCWWECKLVQPLWKTVWRFLKKWKLDLSYDPAIPLLGICPRDTGVLMRRGTCNPGFIAALPCFSFFFNVFIYFRDRERQSMSRGGAEREGDTECEAGFRLWAVSTEPEVGLEPTDCEIMTWAEIKNQTLKREAARWRLRRTLGSPRVLLIT